MRRNWIVLVGAAVLFLSTFFFPDHIDLPRYETFLWLLPVLLLMLMTWRWRGIIWILLGLLVGWSVPGTYRLSVALSRMGYVPAAPAAYQVERRPFALYALVLGCVIIAAGGVWDIVQKRRQQTAAPRAQAGPPRD